MRVAISPPRLLQANLSALAFLPAESLDILEILILAVLHAAGLIALAGFLHLSWIIVVAGLAAFVIFVLLSRRIQVLAPFFFAYGVLLARFVFVRVLRLQVSEYYDYLFPDWGLVLFHVQAAALAASIYSLLIITVILLRSRRRTALLASAILFTGTMTWAGAEYFGHRTHGTTGSDPYAYVQMGVDLATSGSVVHRYDLFPIIAPLKISWYPIVHVGYHLPMDEQGNAVTVFPAGGAFAFAFAYRLFGENALYLVNPSFSLLSALAAGLLAWELTRGYDIALRAVVSATTCGLVATANEQVAWAGVTMVDAQAEFLSVMSLLLALRTRLDKSAWLLVFSGAALGAAYWVRHTQIVLAFSLLIIFLWANPTPRARARAVLLCGAAALLIGIGDLWYHQTYLGGWLHPESEELALFSLGAVSSSAANMFQQTFAGDEFGWLAPFLMLGAVFLARHKPVEFAALLAWLVLSLALHLPYAAVRLRDLLPEFPAVAFLAALGLSLLAAKTLSSRRWQWLAGLLIFASLEVLLLRVWDTMPLAWQGARPIFGYMTESQREAFTRLAEITPPNAVVGSTLNDGAIDLYSNRNTFRPDAWSSAERRGFLNAIASGHPEIYLLDDGPAMEAVLTDLRHDMVVQRVATLDVPLFGSGPAAEPGSLWRIAYK
jgi:hypothetical protein